MRNAEVVYEGSALSPSRGQGCHCPDCRRLVFSIFCRSCGGLPCRQLVCLAYIGSLTQGAKGQYIYRKIFSQLSGRCHNVGLQPKWKRLALPPFAAKANSI